MTQEIACYNNEGILLCSDSLVVAAGAIHESPLRHSFRKLYPLGSHAAVLSAGAKVGIDLSIRLGEMVAYRGLSDAEEVFLLAQEFVNREYGRYVEEGRDWFDSHPDAYRRLYFLVAGYTFRDPAMPFRLYLLGSEDLELPFQLLPTGSLLIMPRRLALEMRLAAALPRSSLADLAELCLGYLRQMGEKEPDRVGGPYYAATITQEGFQWRQGAGPG